VVLFAGLFRNDPRHNAGIYIYHISYIFHISIRAQARHETTPLQMEWRARLLYYIIRGNISTQFAQPSSRLHEQQIDNRGDLAPGPRAFCFFNLNTRRLRWRKSLRMRPGWTTSSRYAEKHTRLFAPFYRLLKKRTKFSLPGQARDTPRESRGGTDACFYCFLQDNNAALRDSYTKLTSALDEAGVPYLTGGASMFLWVLRKTASFFECFPYVCPEPVLAI